MRMMIVWVALALMVALVCADTLNISQGVTSLGGSTFTAKVADLFQKNSISSPYNWVKVSLVLIVISILINGLIYMVARTFQITYLESAFKLETREAFFNVIIIVVFSAFSVFLDNVLATPLLCDTSENCVVNTSVKYMDTLLSAAQGEMVNLEKSALSTVGTSANLGGNVGYFGLTVGYTYDMQGLNKIKTIDMDERIILYRGAAMSLIVVKIFLLYFAYYIGPMLIVFGIMLKCFSVTRRLGSTMLAIGVSCAIVLPLTIIGILLANGVISIPGVEYMKPEGCPDACVKTIVAWNSAGGIDLTDYLDKAQAASLLKGKWADVRGIVTGTKESLAVSGLGTVYSCEYKNIDINTTTVAAYKGKIPDAVVAENITTDCPSNCRSIPYPSDVVECRDAEMPCAALYAASSPLGPKGACFRDNYDYTNLGYNVVYDNAPMNFSLALAESKCFRVTPLAITPKANPMDYCPSSCRFFNADGSTACKDTDPNYYNCSKIYLEAVGLSLTSTNIDSSNGKLTAAGKTAIKSAVSSVYNNIKTALGATPNANAVNTAAITTEAKKVGLPIYETKGPGCLQIMKIPQSIKSVPTYLDCSGCYNEQSKKAGAKTQEGKFMAYSIMLGIFSIAITIAAAIALSMGLEGEMFIPGMERMVR